MVAVVVPWRGGDPYREAALEWTSARWPWPVVLGQAPEGSWCKARAVAKGLSETDAEVLVVADADVFCDTTPAIVEAVQAGAPWGVPHRSIWRLTESGSRAVLKGADPAEQDLEEPNYHAFAGGGITVIRRETWERVPLDPRFLGWGHEDDAWGRALRTLVGPRAQGQGRLWHLWHPPQARKDRRNGAATSRQLHHRYITAYKRPAQMAALLEEIHDHSPDRRRGGTRA